MPYTQLSENDRYVIFHMKNAGRSQVQIAKEIGRSPGTVSRELKRNLDQHGIYFYGYAQIHADQRRTCASQRYKLDASQVGQFVRENLMERWAPEQIVGRLSEQFSDDKTMRVSIETIYRWIYRQSTLGENWYEQLRKRRRRRKRRIPGERSKRGQILGRVGIEHRPAIVETRERVGDWESDTVEGAKGCGLLATHVDRHSRYVLVRKLNDKRASTFNRASIKAFNTLPASLRHTMTADNGKEFSHFKQLERRLGLTVFFANPHAPWERGTSGLRFPRCC